MMNLSVYFLTSFLITFLWTVISKRSFNSFLLCIYHFIIGGLYLYYSLNNFSDAQEYFSFGSLSACKFTDSLNRFDISNPFLIYCTSGLLKKILNNYGFVSSVFTFLGFLGLNYFYLLSLNLTKSKNFYFILLNTLFFLPSISFWTSGISKESLLIVAYSLIIKFVYLENHLFKFKNFFQLTLGLVMTLFIRPYIFLFVIVSILFSSLPDIFNIFKDKDKDKDKDNKTFLIIALSLFLLLPAIYCFGYVLQIGGGFDFDLNKLNFDLFTQRINLNNSRAMDSGGTYINQVGISKLFLILFGPFSSKSINFIVESFTGIVFGIICFSLIWEVIISKFNICRSYFFFTMMICGLELLKFQFAVFNLGIIVRQRIYLVILITVLFAHIINLNYKKKEIIER